MSYQRVQYNEVTGVFIGDSFNEVSDEYIEWLMPNYEVIYNEHYVDSDLKHHLKVIIKYQIS